jgi:hypothetical protein
LRGKMELAVRVAVVTADMVVYPKAFLQPKA